MTDQIMQKILVFAFGAVVGSFLNVCIHRMPANKSIVFPASHCPKCGKRINWYDNIPLLSYVTLLGRCRSCRERISMRYPAVELLTASVILALFTVFGGAANVKFYVYSAFAGALITAAFIDIDINEIPDSISLGGLAAALALSAIFPSLFDTGFRAVAFARSLAGALVGGVVIYSMGVFGKMLFRKEAMGGGDVKLMAMIGAMLGWKLALFTFFVAPVFGAAVGVFMKIRDGRETIAYGPYLSIAAIIAVFFGNEIMKSLFFY
ncbi:MAG: prepilin peptidase [Candidatus Omnitrophota bacterium]